MQQEHGSCCSCACGNEQFREGGKYRRLVKTLKGDPDWTECVVGDITSNGRQG